VISGIGVRPVFIFIAKVRGKGLQKFTPVGQFSFLLRFGESPSHQTLHFGRLGGEVSAPRSRSCHSGRLEFFGGPRKNASTGQHSTENADETWTGTGGIGSENPH
jgi:hypothetical protein